MNATDLLIREELAPLLPLPAGVEPDWPDVRERARQPHRPSTFRGASLLAAALAAVLAVGVATPVGPALARVFDGFSAWISGKPGTPASPAAQQSFEQANARSWAQFAPAAELRRLLEMESSRTHFTLYGFRSGDDLCLRLEAAGGVTATSTHCAPLHALQAATTPALVVAADEPVGTSRAAPGPDGFVPDVYSATFGIASDGVKQVIVRADDGTHEALVAGSAFLYVADHPAAGTRVRGVEAVAGDGSRVALGFESAPYGMLDLAAPPTGTLHGPSQVERHLDGGTIGWLRQLQPRGEPLPADLLARMAPMIAHMVPPTPPRPDTYPQQPLQQLLVRELQPDPNDFTRVALAAVSPTGTMNDPDAGVCYELIQDNSIGGGCSRLSDLFEHSPISLSLGGSGPSQYSLLSGLASDDVAQVKIYLGNGAILTASLRDNVLLARIARSDFPIRVVAYDDEGRVIGIQTMNDDGMSSPAPAEARTTVHQVAHVTGSSGGELAVRAGTPAGGYRCWQIRASDGGEEGGCTPWPPREPLLLLNMLRSGGDFFLAGPLGADVASLTVTFTDGKTANVKPIDGFVALPIPADAQSDGDVTIVIHAFDATGKQVAARGLKASS